MPKQILVADDDPILLNLYTRMLAGTGFSVSRASTFAEAATLIGVASENGKNRTLRNYP